VLVPCVFTVPIVIVEREAADEREAFIFSLVWHLKEIVDVVGPYLFVDIVITVITADYIIVVHLLVVIILLWRTVIGYLVG